ncbi:MAG TPA: hypothetical protein VK030_01520 [Actinomycetales bacterium]|nr:hypothetical protein [Actinomycetales bacterium]
MLSVFAEAAEGSSLGAPPIVFGLVVLGIAVFGLLVTVAFKSVGTRHK